MGSLVERIQVLRAKSHDLLHRDDIVSTIPEEILVEAEKKAGVHRRFIDSDIYRRMTRGDNTPLNVRTAVDEDVSVRVQQNIGERPDILQPRVESVIAIISAFVINENRLNEQAEIFAYTDSFASDDVAMRRESAKLMLQTGLIEQRIYMRRNTLRGLLKLSKKIDPVLRKA